MRADWKGSVEVEAWWMNWPPSVSESNFFFSMLPVEHEKLANVMDIQRS